MRRSYVPRLGSSSHAQVVNDSGRSLSLDADDLHSLLIGLLESSRRALSQANGPAPMHPSDANKLRRRAHAQDQLLDKILDHLEIPKEDQ